MKWWKHVAKGAATFVLASALTACGVVSSGNEGGSESSKKDDDKIVIGFSMDTLKEERWQRDKELFEAKVKELGAEVKTLAANGDDAAQLSQAEQLISEGVDVLVVVPHNAEASAAIVEKAHKEGIPVISYDRLIKNAEVDYYVSFDNVRVGEMQAQAIVEKAPKGNYVYIGGADTDNNAHLFRQGAMNVLKPLEEKGDIKIVYDQFSKDWKPEEALKNMENALTANNNNIQAVVAANDGTAGGVIQALAAQGLAGKVPVSGQDAELAALQRIVEGTQTMTVYKPIKAIATKAAEMAVALAKGEKIETNQTVSNGKIDVPSVLLDPIAVTKDNVLDTVIKDGYHKLEDVFKNVPKDQWPKQ
ncbi:ribose ABC transporter substrate-binding protein [Anoxybacillus gonensis]|uniref:D-xylose-binding periplasmic protein n=1 Tax=Anoxybacillus gonensis TaxID=198467 RepID=A0AAW7TKU8_9BACL|nr:MULTISPECIES: D-xylose ABC transporter substrate-binding protein [Anoxybacillus]NNU97249.1 D-xylose ABC transporter substrate-binding protein [Anoxybacillus sp. EFIL]AKS38490.1 ribose ABC transporter substrate-binding protein [Anoxybacillus gonensis]EMI11156.1 ribose ABC transporter periplasmic protein [Anoxybacillus gonensis]EPZ39402.1 ribose ABC transporter periplasmic protein [Anoxybacillus ayderensis]KGP59746.1 ribose ABC transporter substrate-binding protein [Anoxybacillus gonensis]